MCQNLEGPFIRGVFPALGWDEFPKGFKCLHLHQIGRFLKVPGSKFSCKSSPNIWRLFGLSWKKTLVSKIDVDTLMAIIWNTRAPFYSNIWSHFPQLTVSHLNTDETRLSLVGTPTRKIFFGHSGLSNNLFIDNFPKHYCCLRPKGNLRITWVLLLVIYQIGAITELLDAAL